MEAIYFNYAKKIEKYESLEFVEVLEIPLPKEGVLKQDVFSIPIKTKEGSKVLWKINFKIKPRIVSDLHISFSW